MRQLYLDLSMGAAGDMLAAALLELIEDREGFVCEMNALDIPGVSVSTEQAVRCGVRGTHFSVLVGGADEESFHHGHGEHHHHTGVHDIADVIAALPVSEKVKADISAVYALIAEAESAVHGVPVSEIHFHEVGAMDAVADVCAVSLLMERLAPVRVTASGVNVGGGTVRCAHGVLPVPAPATAHILKGIPSYGEDVRMELCTPTGAALIKHFVSEFAPMPLMRPEAVGYGMGTRDVPDRPNALRAILGEAEASPERLTELCANIDDMTGEELGFAMEQLFASGALDVWTTPIGMKKSRPAVMLSCLCREEDAPLLRETFFRNTATLGIREYAPARYVLPREERVVETPCGKVRIKRATLPEGECREKPEYEDIARIARERGVPLAKARELIK